MGVVVRVVNTGSGQTVQANAQGGGYMVQFTTTETEKFVVGDVFEIQVLSAANPSLPYGIGSYELTAADLENKTGAATKITIDRTSTYTIQGSVLDKNGEAAIGATIIATAPQAQVTTTAEANGKYRVRFVDLATNPVVNDEIVLVTQIEGELPRQTILRAFETPTRIVEIDLIPMRLGGLSINSGQYRDFIDRLVARAIEKTSVGQLLQGELMKLVRNDPGLRNSMVPGGLLPTQVLLSPELPLVFADPENKDLENFGNGVVPAPLSGLLDGLGELNMGFTPFVTGDKLDLYLSILNPEVAKVEFELNGLQSTISEAEKVMAGGTFPHTFQFDEELAAAFLPVYPGGNAGQMFAAVTLRYAEKDLPEPTADEGPKTLEEQIQEKVDQVLEDITDISDNATEVLGNRKGK